VIEFSLNGKKVRSESDPLARLVDVIREEMGDTTVKEGCGEGECGSCTVLMDGRIVNSCLIPVIQVENRNVVTMAGFGKTDRGKALISAFEREGAVQCGFCIPGMVLAGEAILSANPEADEKVIRAGISGNLCRCTGYDLIVRAIASAAKQGRGLW
jgi:carbon-monoxide dehydrogenase small subunit